MLEFSNNEPSLKTLDSIRIQPCKRHRKSKKAGEWIYVLKKSNKQRGKHGKHTQRMPGTDKDRRQKQRQVRKFMWKKYYWTYFKSSDVCAEWVYVCVFRQKHSDALTLYMRTHFGIRFAYKLCLFFILSLSVAVIIIAAHTVDVLLLFSLLFYLFPHRMPPSWYIMCQRVSGELFIKDFR